MRSKRFSFLSKFDEEKLVKLVRDYISVGELELAKSGVEQLCLLNIPRALEVLSEFIYQQNFSETIWRDNREIQLQFLWFCTNEYCSILQNEHGEEAKENLVMEQRKLIEFEIFLYESFTNFYGKIVNTSFQEILRYFQNLVYNPRLITALPKKAFEELEAILTVLPQNGHVLFKYLCNTKVQRSSLGEQKYKEVTNIAQETTLKLHNIFIKIMDSMVDKRQFSQMLIYMQYLDIINFEDATASPHLQSILEYLKSLFLRILATCSSEGKSSIITLKIQIYESLLACSNYDALRMFCELEDLGKVKHTQSMEYLLNPFNPVKSISLPRPFDIYKRKLINQKQLLEEYFHYIRITKNHIFEFTLEQCFELAKNKQFEDLDLYLKLFPKLTPLFLLIIPTHIHNSNLILQLCEMYCPSIGESYRRNEYTDYHLFDHCNYNYYLLQVEDWLKSQFPALKPLNNLYQKIGDAVSIIHLLSELEIVTDENKNNQLLIFLMEDEKDSPKTRQFKQYNRSILLIHSILSTVTHWMRLPPNKSAKLQMEKDVGKIKKLLDCIDDVGTKIDLIEALLDYVYIKPKQPPTDPNDESEQQNEQPFIITSDQTEMLLRLSRSCLPQIDQEIEQQYSQKSKVNQVDDIEQFEKTKFHLQQRKHQLDIYLHNLEFRFNVVTKYPKLKVLEEEEERPFLCTLFEPPQSLIMRCIDNSDFERCNEAKHIFSVDDEMYQTLLSAERLNSLLLLLKSRKLPEKNKKMEEEEWKQEDERLQSQLLPIYRSVPTLIESIVLSFEVIFSPGMIPAYYRIILSLIPQILKKFIEENENQENQLNTYAARAFKDLLVKCKLLDEFFVQPISQCWDAIMVFFDLSDGGGSNTEITSQNLQKLVLSRYSIAKIRELINTSNLLYRNQQNKIDIENLRTIKKYFRSKEIVPQLFDYLAHFVDYIFQVGEILLKNDEYEEEEEDEENLSIQNYLQVLKRSPDTIVSDIVFSRDTNSIDNIKKISKIFNKDVICSMIHAINKNRMTSLADKNKNIHSVIIQDNVYDLSKESITVFYQKSPTLSVFISQLLHPLDRFNSYYLSNALVNAKQLCSPLAHKTLYYFIKHRSTFYQLFAKYYLKTDVLDTLNDNSLTVNDLDTLEYSNLLIENYTFREHLADLSSEYFDREKFILQLSEHLASIDEVELAVNILDENFVDGLNDLLIERLILKIASFKQENSIDHISELIRRFKNLDLAKNAIFTYFNNWKITKCLDLLSFISKRFELDHQQHSKSNNAAGIFKIKKEMELYKEILTSHDTPSRKNSKVTWQSVASACRASPTEYVRSLFITKQFKIAEKIIDYFGLDEHLRLDLVYAEIYSLYFDHPTLISQSQNNNQKSSNIAAKSSSNNNITTAVEAITDINTLFNYEIRERLLQIFTQENGIITIEKIISKLIQKSPSNSSNSPSLSPSTSDHHHQPQGENRSEKFVHDLPLLSFLIQFLTRTLLTSQSLISSLKLFTFQKLLEIETSIKILNELNDDPKMKESLVLLIQHPFCMIENLIMNQRVREIENILHVIPQAQNNDLFIYYIEKIAIQIPSLVHSPSLSITPKLNSSHHSQSVNNNNDNNTTNINSTAVNNNDTNNSNALSDHTHEDTPSSGRAGEEVAVLINNDEEERFINYLKGDDPKDHSVRSNFTFMNPSIAFIQSLLSFCTEKRKVHQKIMQILNQLTLLSSQADIDLHKLADVLLSFASYAKKLILSNPSLFPRQSQNDSINNHINNDDDDEEGEFKKQTFTSSAEKGKDESQQLKHDELRIIEALLRKYKIYQQLIMINTIPRMSLADFEDRTLIGQVRDKLMDDEYLNLAIQLSDLFKLTPEPPTIKLGLSLLTNGYYSEAKEILMNVLREKPEGEELPPEIAESQDAIVKSIVTTLENHVVVDAQSLREKLTLYQLNYNNQSSDDHLTLSETTTSSSSSSNTIPTGIGSGGPHRVRQAIERNPYSFDQSINYDMKKKINQTAKFQTTKYMEYNISEYYLTHFGSGKLLVQFYLRNHQIEQAINHIVLHHLPKGLFVEVVGGLLQSDNGYLKLKSFILKFDPNLEKSKDYLLSLCRYFAENKVYEYLYDMQLFLKDYCRAGLSSISQYKKSSDLPSKLKFLESAKGHFISAIDSGQCKSPDSKLREYEVNAKLREITLQGDILKYYHNNDKSNFPKLLLSLSIFGSDEEKSKIADYILYTGNFDLTFRILKECSIEMVSFFKNTTIRHAKAGRLEAVNDILNSTKKYLSDDVRDIVIVSVIRAIIEGGDKKSAEKLIPKISSLEEKVNAYILCGNFKTAFNIATHENRADVVNVIKEMAVSQMSSTPSLSKIVSQCDNYLEKRYK